MNRTSDPVLFEKSHSSSKTPYSNGFKVGLNTWFLLYKNLFLWPDTADDNEYQVGYKFFFWSFCRSNPISSDSLSNYFFLLHKG